MTRDAALQPVALRRLVDLVASYDRTLTGGLCRPRGSALAASRAISTAGCPCSRAHKSGAPCPAPVSEGTAGALRRALLLDTCLFSSSSHLLPGFSHWASFISATTRQGLWASPGSCHGLAASACVRPGPRTARLRLGACPGPGAPSTLLVLPALRWCCRLPLGPRPPALALSACAVAYPAATIHRCSCSRTRQRPASARSIGQPFARRGAWMMISRLLPRVCTAQPRVLLGSAGAWISRTMRT